MTYYRIQSAAIDPTDLLDPELQWSESYSTGTERAGKSVCDSIEALAEYFTVAGVPLSPTGDVLVELDGDLSDEPDEDAALGALLVFPTRVVSVGPIPEAFFDAVDAILDAAA